MELAVDAILAVAREHRRVDGRPLDEQDGHWSCLGGLCVRNDSSITLSGRQYADFVKPHDRRLLQPWGGFIHFCGKGHQWLDEMLDIPGLRGLNISQGEFYDLEQVFGMCEAAGVAIVGWAQPIPTCLRERIRTGLSRVTYADGLDTALRMKERLHATGHADDAP
jgi:hypothetical protein